MVDQVVLALNTTVAEAGNTQTASYSFLKEDKPSRFSASIASGDTVVIEGKAEADDAFETLHTFTDNTPADIYLSRLWRARRTVDGGVGDSEIMVENRFNENWESHT